MSRVIEEHHGSIRVEEESASLRKELGLTDLVLTQILYVVGLSWVGAAAKLGIARSTLDSKIRTLKINKNRFKAPPEP